MTDVRKRYNEYCASWGHLSSVAPHPRTAPGFTTGGVLHDLSEAADEIDRLREENEWLKAQLPSSPEAAAAGGGFDPYNP